MSHLDETQVAELQVEQVSQLAMDSMLGMSTDQKYALTAPQLHALSNDQAQLLFGHRSLDTGNTLHTSESNTHIAGGAGEDVLFAENQVNVLFGLEGNDTIVLTANSISDYGALNSSFYKGGEGFDTIKLDAQDEALALDFRLINSSVFKGFDAIDISSISYEEPTQLFIRLSDLLTMREGDGSAAGALHTFYVKSSGGGEVTLLGDDWSVVGYGQFEGIQYSYLCHSDDLTQFVAIASSLTLLANLPT